MATLTEIFGVLNSGPLAEKVAAACLVAAQAVMAESAGTTNHANRLKWALAVLHNPAAAGVNMLRAVVAANNSATLAQITGASDATIQSAVNNAVDTFADGSGGV